MRDTRAASHAGDWYTSQSDELDFELSSWLKAVGPTDEPFPVKKCKAIIAPIVGSDTITATLGTLTPGPAAAWAYKSIDTTGIKRVFILGPSHHFYLEGCALSSCKEYDTPIGKLPLDIETIEELRSTGRFESMSIKADEAEHSIEMHLPYIRKVFEGQDIKIVPIVVGAISREEEASFGSLIAPYLEQENTFCVVSSDFCHWGTRFSYTYYYPDATPSDASPAIHLSRSVVPTSSQPIHKSISQLDHEAMKMLTLPPSTAADAHVSFARYLAKTKNTICGRHPIGVLLGALASLEKEKGIQPTLEWVKYEQSSACLTIRDSSVSYASAWVRF
ncbi:MEMO1 family [Lyophyllum atratum]|nr:MEMO1 family [Lyophyllum atratum]